MQLKFIPCNTDKHLISILLDHCGINNCNMNILTKITFTSKPF